MLEVGCTSCSLMSMTKAHEELLIASLPNVIRYSDDEITTTIAALESAASHIEEFGWTKGRMFNVALDGGYSDWGKAPSCLVGSIRWSVGDYYGDSLRAARLVNVVTDLINIEDGRITKDGAQWSRLHSATGWNDAYAKNKAQVARLLRRAARIIRKAQEKSAARVAQSAMR